MGGAFHVALGAAWRLVLSLWVGGIALFTFLLTPALFAQLPREEAGRIVGILFPLYFPWLSLLSLLALAVFALLRRGRWRGVHALAALLLLLAVGSNGINQLWIHPASRELKREVHAGEADADDHPSRQRFARLHGVSMTLNLLVLSSGVVLLLGGPLWWRERDGGGRR